MQTAKVRCRTSEHASEGSTIMMPARPAELDVAVELEELRNSTERESGVARKVLISYPDLQITLRHMRANSRIPEHYNPWRVSVQTVFGHIQMHADGKLFDLPAGKILVLDRYVVHDVEALAESAFLLIAASPQTTAQ